MELGQAKKIAQWLVMFLKPACERIEIAGSIRRECKEVKDIEILAIPKFDMQPKVVKAKDLFSQDQTLVVKVNLLVERLKEIPKIRWIKPNTSVIQDWPLKEGGKYFRGYIESVDIKVDVFTANKDNWGLIHAIRTGPYEYSYQVFALKWVKLGYKSQEGVLTKNGKALPIREEADLFNLLHIPFVEARNRVV